MRIQQKTVKEFIFTQEEALQIMHALDYINHRQKDHSKALHVSKDFVEYARSVIRAE